MSSLTIKETLVDLKAKGYDVSSGFHGLPLKFEFATREQVENNKEHTQLFLDKQHLH